MNWKGLGTPVVLLGLGLGAIGVGASRLSDGGEVVSTDVSDAAAPVAVLLPAGAGASEEPAPDTSPEADAGEAIACINDELGFGLSYPADWHTLAFTARQECRFFGSAPLEFTADTRYPPAEIAIYRIEADYDEWVGAYNEPSLTLESKEEGTVGGRPATRIVYEYDDGTGSGGVYVVEAPDATLVVQAEDKFSPDIAASIAVLDEIAETLVFL